MRISRFSRYGLAICGSVASLVALIRDPANACAVPNRPVEVIKLVQPDFPEPAKEIGLGAITVNVKVTVDSRGDVINAIIYEPPDHPGSRRAAFGPFEEAAIQAARASTYRGHARLKLYGIGAKRFTGDSVLSLVLRHFTFFTSASRALNRLSMSGRPAALDQSSFVLTPQRATARI